MSSQRRHSVSVARTAPGLIRTAALAAAVAGFLGCGGRVGSFGQKDGNVPSDSQAGNQNNNSNARCGNGVAETDETCDGSDLRSNDCTTIGLGFTGGDLACLADCSGFDTSGCTTDTPPTCAGNWAYLHGDLWPMWYNMRNACDPEHKAWWRCERIHGQGAPQCSLLDTMYHDCITTWNSGRCMAGVYAPTDSTGCWLCPSHWSADTCDTRTFDYDSTQSYGSYYGVQWDSYTNWHRHLTVHICDVNTPSCKDVSGNLIAAFSTCPTRDGCYMDNVDNFGVGPDPPGFIHTISSAEKFTAKFGRFACIRVPANQPLKLWASWMNEFCHTCHTDYPSYPYTPCWTEDIQMIFEPGRHYLWTERGVELMGECTGPPPDIAAEYPEAVCDTSAP